MNPSASTLWNKCVEPACLAILVALLLVACDDPTPTPVSNATPPTTEPVATELRRGYEIPIPMVENWEGTQIRKYTYEMRFDADGKLHRNGWSQAFYSSGELEREGSYRFDPVESRSDRVGLWTYYDPDGSINRTEDRGGESLWTAPDQRASPPGTAP
ncbi:MAG: hypothetical protein CBB69_008400 [Phycisphaera sp. TMED9]|nr:MAG: hypothetical protein CBB69_008400 [Phycisphaera sp. TMED9]